MSNRRKPRNPTASLEGTKVDIPIQEQSVHKRVPAVIHWATVDGVDRTDDETIGEAVIYEDGTSDVLVFSEISEDAKKVVGIINGQLDNLSMEN